MKRILLIFLALLTILSLCACDGDSPDTDSTAGTQAGYREVLPAAEGRTRFVQFKMTDGMTFVVELYPEYAPQTVENFQGLVESGFYSGLTFHRIVKNFMIQGGDPNGNGTGSSSQNIYGEFANNGFTQNTLSHVRGVLSMARATSPNTASCQFFIMNADYTGLDRNYAAFGRVVAGMETIDAITALPVEGQPFSTEESKPVVAPVIESAVFVNFEGETTPPTLFETQQATTQSNSLNIENCYTEVLPAAEGVTEFVQFKMHGGATFVVELYPEYAPQTVQNFQNLVGSGFYNGLTFHRIYKDFMIQGGDPEGNGTGTIEGGTIPGEFSANGFTQNTLKHERGVISMARRTDPNSASCQFFIMHATTASLDGNYAAFGRVVAGMDTIDELASLAVERQLYSNEMTKPVVAPVMESVTFVHYTPAT